MVPNPILRRLGAISAASFAVGLFLIAAADPADARKKKRVRAPEPQPTLNGKAAVAVVSIKDQRISLYDADGQAVRSRISSGQTKYETPVGVFSILEKRKEHYSNLYDNAPMPFMQRITWSGIAFHGGVLPGYPASHGCVRLRKSFARQIFSLTKVGMRVVISRDDIAPVSIAHPLLFNPEPLGATPVAIPAAYEPPKVSDARATIMKPDVRRWPARQALLEQLKAEAETKAEESKTAAAHWKKLKAGLNKHKRKLSLIAKRERAKATKVGAEKKLGAAEKKLADAKSKRAIKRAKSHKDWAAKSLAKAEKYLVKATSAAEEADKFIAPLREEVAAAEAAKTAAAVAASEAKRNTLPISVFVSAKSQKLYVRQGNKPVFDTEIKIADPDLSIGTHVFTALDFAGEGDDVRWNVVTISRRSAGLPSKTYRKKRKSRRGVDKTYAPPVTDAKVAAGALERISIPDDVRARISKYVWPGSSLIISDEELSKETGKNTDFVVVASNEPKGALKTRKRRKPRYYDDYYYDDYYYSYRRPSRRGYRLRRRRPQNNSVFSWW